MLGKFYAAAGRPEQNYENSGQSGEFTGQNHFIIFMAQFPTISVSPLSIKKSEKSQPPHNGQLASMAPYMARPQCRCMAMLLIKFSLADASPALISTIPISDRVCDCPSVFIASGGSSSAPSPPNAMVLKCL